MQLLTAQPILDNLSFANLPHQPAQLAIILVGEDKASHLYVAKKEEQAHKYGIATSVLRFEETISQAELINEINRLNHDQTVTAMIVQLPLPEHIETDAALDTIMPQKDVDNLTNKNVFISPMVLSIESLIKTYTIDLKGKHICVVGQGRLIGKPVKTWLESRDLMPVVIDEETEDADFIVREADIIFAGSGQRHIINEQNVHKDQIIFDCSGRDVDFEAVKDKVAALTPPKGGIGPLTVHFLLQNTLKASQK